MIERVNGNTRPEMAAVHLQHAFDHMDRYRHVCRDEDLQSAMRVLGKIGDAIRVLDILNQRIKKRRG